MEDEIDSELKEMEAEEKGTSILKQRVYPALDFTNNEMLLTLWQPSVSEEGDPIEVPFILTSNKLYLPWAEQDDFLPLLRPQPNTNRFSDDGIKEFLDGKSFDIPFIFEKIKQKIKHYIDLGDDERKYTLLACWTIGTYLFPLFNSYPYIYLNAAKRSGKSKILTLMNCLCFNAMFNICMTEATLFRIVQGFRSTLLIDETEELSSKALPTYRALLLGGYKKGVKVPRAREISKSKDFIIEQYDIFGPKMLANIGGIDDVLEDRCLTMVLLRTAKRSIAHRQINTNAQDWQDIRDALYITALTKWKEVKHTYELLQDYFDAVRDIDSVLSVDSADSVACRKRREILGESEVLYDNDKKTHVFTSPTHTTYTTLTTLIPQFSMKKELERLTTDLSKNLKMLEDIDGRQLELWMPMLSVGMCISTPIFMELCSLCIEQSGQKVEEDINETADYILIQTLLDIQSQYKEDFCPIAAIKGAFALKMDDVEWINSKWIGRAMKRLGFSEKRRLSGGVEIRLNQKHLENLAIRFRIQKSQVAEDQKTLEKPIETLPTKILRLYNKLRQTMGIEVLLYELQVAAEDEDISEADFEAGLKKLTSDGLLFSPRKDYVRSSQ